MPDMEVLKQRVENAEQRLTSVQSTRERECEALMDMWLQIKTRFQDQEQEIASYRSKVAALQDANVELACLIDSMIGRIEGTVTDSTDETVPRIAGMAKDLLESEPTGENDVILLEDAEEDEEPLILEPFVNSGIVSRQERGISKVNGKHEDATQRRPRIVSPSDDESDILELTEAVHGADMSSPGIKNLLSRIERAVNRGPGGDRYSDDDRIGEIDPELKEIEHLRNELNGLRARISSSGPAE